jgi:peptide/nickel transport system permease protein
MVAFLVRRVLMIIPTLIAISIVSFLIIELPPGDFLTSYVTQLAAMGDLVDESSIQALRDQYGLGQPIYVQYFRWISNMAQGDFGRSMEWRPVAELIGERLALTFVLSLFTCFYLDNCLSNRIFSAVRQYSIGDYIASFLGSWDWRTGSCLPGSDVDHCISIKAWGLFSPEFVEQGWSLEKLWDLAKHLVIQYRFGLSGT